ncbi:hypothetical protein [Gimesia maris]|uniref:hypothetical protein n=1 Tax=Gimesia maris TaxID=122 RepID=UPI003A8E5B5F
MKTISVHRYSDLKKWQWLRVISTIKKQVKEIAGEDCYVGIGRKYRQDKAYGWQIAARIYLQRKRKRVTAKKRIPPSFHVRLQRNDGGYDTIKIRSDVESAFNQTGRRIALLNATTGYLVRWIDENNFRRWGFITVAHIFDDTQIRSVSIQISNSVRVDCQVRAVSGAQSGIDAAILEIRQQQGGGHPETALHSAGLITNTNPPKISTLTTPQIQSLSLSRSNGCTYPPVRKFNFECENEQFPYGVPLGRRTLQNCIVVRQENADVFKVGTSGSLWTINGFPACMQVGGRPNNYDVGLGQSFHFIAPWIKSALRAISIKLVRAF